MMDEPQEQRNDESAGERNDGSREGNRATQQGDRRPVSEEHAAHQARRFGAQDLDDSMSARGDEERGEIF